MRTTLLTATLTLAAIINTLGAEFYQVEGGPQPDHLVPVRAPGEYERKIARNLFVTGGSFGRMVVRPSFEPEFCLSVHADIPQASLKKHDGWLSVPDEEKTYILTLTYAEASIWDTIHQGSEKPKRESVRVKQIDRTISLELAVAIQRVWGKALQLTRYPSVASNGLDGATYQFSVWVRGLGDLQGETWSPERGLPKDLVDVGTALVAFARQDVKGKALTEHALINNLKNLESKIPKP